MPTRRAPWLLAVALLSCTARPAIRPFTSDGCTLFPDGTPGDHRLWCGCCFAHDIAYWRGGTEAERLRADQALRACVLEKTGDPRVATMMYDGVRLGGSAAFPNWYRWGYGWPWGRGYQPLTDRERAQSEERLREYFAANPGGYCARK
jgi:hypothetical protein